MDVLINSIQWGMTILTVPVAARLRRGFYNLLENHKIPITRQPLKRWKK
jgi:hypothetical protein